MNQYLTPLKDNNQISQKQSKTAAQPRQGDWLCFNCQNLNFSFRKKCNRCKVQTREQNQQVSKYYCNYFPQECYFLEQKENFPSLQNQNQQCTFFAQKTDVKLPAKIVPARDNERVQQTPERSRKRAQLPSVSPLVKRYNRHENNSTQQSKKKGLFEDEGLWANIDLTYLDDPHINVDTEEQHQIPEQIEEIERIIQRIML